MTDSDHLSSPHSRVGPSLSLLDSRDIIDALNQLPTKIVLLTQENERLRAENQKQKMELDQMSFTYLELKNQKIKELEAEVIQLRERNEKLKSSLGDKRRREEEDSDSRNKMDLLLHENERLWTENEQKKMELDRMSSTVKTALELQKKNIRDLEADVVQVRGGNEEREDCQSGRRGGERDYTLKDEERHKCCHLTSVVGMRMQGLLLGRREKCDAHDREASPSSMQRLQQQVGAMHWITGERLTAFMKFPNFACICGVHLRSGLAVINHFNDKDHIKHRLYPVYQSDVNFWSEMITRLREGEILPDL